jgi:hypothetical protein
MEKIENCGYKIPTPLKDVVRNISKCVYNSPFCKYGSIDIATSIVASAVQNRSIDSVSKSPNPDTVFWRIYNGIDIGKLTHLAKNQRPPKGTHLKVLIDGHDRMFHGKDTLGVVGTKPKEGSHRAFKYLVAFSDSDPKGIVAIEELFDGSVTEDAERMIRELAREHAIDLVIMDGEFYKAEFIEYLEDAGIKFLTRRTDTSNIRELNISYGKPHLYKKDVERPNGRIIHLRYWLYRYKGKEGDFYLASNLREDAKNIRKLYKSRWRIETGFREINRVEIKTTTRDFLVRLFFYIVSCMIYNLWQKVRFRCNLFTIRFDEILSEVKKYIHTWLLDAVDMLMNPRLRHIRLRFW